MANDSNGYDKALAGKSEFLIRILYRENCSWQGEIHWLDGNKKQYFRSLLEMVTLMQEVVEPGTGFRSFNDRVDEVS